MCAMTWHMLLSRQAQRQTWVPWSRGCLQNWGQFLVLAIPSMLMMFEWIASEARLPPLPSCCGLLVTAFQALVRQAASRGPGQKRAGGGDAGGAAARPGAQPVGHGRVPGAASRASTCGLALVHLGCVSSFRVPFPLLHVMRLSRACGHAELQRTRFHGSPGAGDRSDHTVRLGSHVVIRALLLQVMS